MEKSEGWEARWKLQGHNGVLGAATGSVPSVPADNG